MADPMTQSQWTTGAKAALLALCMSVTLSCTTGGPVLTGSSSTLGSGTTSATPTPAATATPTVTPTATPGATPTPSASPTATPSPTNGVTVISEGTFALGGGVVALFAPFDLGSAGTLDFIADWVSIFDDIDLGISRGECTVALFEANQCDFLGVADSAFNKPEELVLAVTPGKYTHAIANATASTEIVAFQLVFVPSSAASAASTRAEVARLRAHYGGAMPALLEAPRGLKGRAPSAR